MEELRISEGCNQVICDFKAHVGARLVFSNRTRRYITTNNNPNTEIVTYTIVDNHDHRYSIDDFAPSSYYEVSAPVTLSVYVKPFVKRIGDASYTLCIQKNYHPITKSEAF